MRLTRSAVAKLVTNWFEKFELRELQCDKPAFPTDDVLFALCHHADCAYRRGNWRLSLWERQLALDLADVYPVKASEDEQLQEEQQAEASETDKSEEKATTYSTAVAHLYAGAFDLACRDSWDALKHFERSANLFENLGRRCAQSIARAAVSLTHYERGELAEALTAYHGSILAIDEIATPSSSDKELRRQVLRTMRDTLDP